MRGYDASSTLIRLRHLLPRAGEGKIGSARKITYTYKDWIVFLSLSLPLLVFMFIMAAAIVWFAGIQLSKTMDVIDSRFAFGEALGAEKMVKGFQDKSKHN